MYGPPQDCKGKGLGEKISLRQCIRLRGSGFVQDDMLLLFGMDIGHLSTVLRTAEYKREQIAGSDKTVEQQSTLQPSPDGSLEETHATTLLEGENEGKASDPHRTPSLELGQSISTLRRRGVHTCDRLDSTAAFMSPRAVPTPSWNQLSEKRYSRTFDPQNPLVRHAYFADKWITSGLPTNRHEQNLDQYFAIHGLWQQMPGNIATWRMTGAALLGNGSVGVAIGGEALDHDLSAVGRPRAGMINFTPRSADLSSSAQAVI